ncbi:MAG: RNA methyltransferase [Bacteroidales bacterium]|nr:RNA methyltransferase [Bacteroidales bacterium]
MTISENTVKWIRSLHLSKHREQHQCFIVEGPKIVGELILSDMPVHGIYGLRPWLEEHSGILEERGIPYGEVTEVQLGRISCLTTPNRVLAVAKMLPPRHIPLEEAGKGLIIVLDSIRDPGNMGTLLRLADWFGVKCLVASHDSVELYNPKVIQASMGSFLRLSLVFSELKGFLAALHDRVLIYGAMINGESIWDTPLRKDAVLVIGNESRGISPDLLPMIHHAVAIPSFSGDQSIPPDSLNAPVAAAIICAEIMRQNR